jgi:hypothetical protein
MSARPPLTLALALTTALALTSAMPAHGSTSAHDRPSRSTPSHERATGAIVFTQAPATDGPPLTSFISPAGGRVTQPRLPGGGSLYPRLSPDGRHLVAGILTDTGLKAAVMHPDGTHFHWVRVAGLVGPELDVSPCSWLTEQVLLCSVRTLTGGIDGIYRIDLTGQHQPVRLTANPYPRRENFGGGDVIGDISPDGRRMVFTRARPVPPPGAPAADQSGALFVSRTDGSHLRRITQWGLPNSHDNGVESWGDHGRRIVFGTEDGQIATIGPDGSHLHVIRLRIPDDSYAFAPSWAPHGPRIAFGLYPAPDFQPDLYIADLRSGRVRQLTDNPDTDDTPDWGVANTRVTTNRQGASRP